MFLFFPQHLLFLTLLISSYSSPSLFSYSSLSPAHPSASILIFFFIYPSFTLCFFLPVPPTTYFFYSCFYSSLTGPYFSSSPPHSPPYSSFHTISRFYYFLCLLLILSSLFQLFLLTPSHRHSYFSFSPRPFLILLTSYSPNSSSPHIPPLPRPKAVCLEGCLPPPSSSFSPYPSSALVLPSGC